MKDFDTFYKILKEVKDRFNNLKDEEFANKCGISRQSVDDIIKGITKNPRVSLIYNLQENLHVNPQYFFEEGAPIVLDGGEKSQTDNDVLDEMRVLFKKYVELQLKYDKVVKERDELRKENKDLKKTGN